MSFVYALIFLLLLGGAGFGGWKAALYWNNRTRDARHEDPRDQEIRELGAALSIARKNLEKLDNRSGSSAHELAVLQDQVNVTAAALAESQEKIGAANAAVNREIETREALDARLAQMRRDLDTAKSRVAELEVQVKIVSPSSGLVAGLDDVLEDDEKEVFTIRHEHKVFKQQVTELEQAMTVEKAESARWKQHCNVMGKANKSLRQRTDELGVQLKDLDDLKLKAAQLITATADNVALRKEAAELQKVAAEVPLLTIRIAELAGVRDENLLLQTEVAKLAGVNETNALLLQQLADFAATQARLVEAQQDNQCLQTRLTELTAVEQENGNLHARIDALVSIETDNEALRSQIHQQQSRHSDELNCIRIENEQLQVRVAAIDQIQEENTQLLLQNRELRPIQARVIELQNQLISLQQSDQEQRNANVELGKRIENLMLDLRNADKLRGQITAMNAERAAMTAQLLELRETTAQLESAREEANRLQAAETAQLRSGIGKLQTTESELRETIVKLEADRNTFSQQLVNAHSLPAATSPQDDLKSIRGVGARLEQKLNMIGICNFRDLVELEENAYERAAQLIPDLANRIQRDNWLQQARDLHHHKYHETI